MKSQQKERNNINSNVSGLVGGSFFGGGSKTRQGCARNQKFGFK